MSRPVPDYGIRTKKEVGRMLGVTRGAIYQAERKFLDQLRRRVLADATLRQAAVEMGLNVPRR